MSLLPMLPAFTGFRSPACTLNNEPEPKTENKKSETRNPKSGHKTQNTEPGTQISKPATQNPEPKTQNPQPKTIPPLPSTRLLLPFALLALLFLAGCLGPQPPAPPCNPPQPCPPPPPIQLEPLLGFYMGVAAMLIFISLLLMLLVYVFGNILANDKMKAWARQELFEIIYTIILLAFALFATQQAGSVVSSLVQGNDPFSDCICSDNFVPANVPGTVYYGIPESQCHIRLAIYFLQTIFQEGRSQNLKIYISYIATATLADAQLTLENVMEPAGMSTFAPWRGVWSMGNTIKEDVFDKYIIVMMLSMFQSVLVRFIAVALYPMLFVIGAVLRAFTFTRKLGGLLMALALSLFFIYPMFYAFGALIVNQVKYHAFLTDPERDPDPSFADRLVVSGTIAYLGTKDAQGTPHRLDLSVEQKKALDAVSKTFSCGDVVLKYELPSGQAMANTQNLVTGFGAFAPLKDNTKDPNFEAERQKAGSIAQQWLQESAKKKWFDYYTYADVFQNGGLVDILARLMFFSVFFGLLGVLATIAAVKNLSTMLGGDTELAGLTRLI